MSWALFAQVCLLIILVTMSICFIIQCRKD